MLNKPITLSPGQLWVAITVVGALVAATATVTWEVRKDAIEALKRQVEAYEKSSTWKLPETLVEIKKASETLTMQLSDRKELEALRSESAKGRTEHARLSEALAQSEAMLVAANATLDKLVHKSNSVELTEGQSTALVENKIYLGVTIATSTSTHVTLENRSAFLNVGESKEYSFAGKSCQVTLLRVTEGAPRRATFSYGCA